MIEKSEGMHLQSNSNNTHYDWPFVSLLSVMFFNTTIWSQKNVCVFVCLFKVWGQVWWSRLSSQYPGDRRSMSLRIIQQVPGKSGNGTLSQRIEQTNVEGKTSTLRMWRMIHNPDETWVYWWMSSLTSMGQCDHPDPTCLIMGPVDATFTTQKDPWKTSSSIFPSDKTRAAHGNRLCDEF